MILLAEITKKKRLKIYKKIVFPIFYRYYRFQRRIFDNLEIRTYWDNILSDFFFRNRILCKMKIPVENLNQKSVKKFNKHRNFGQKIKKMYL